MENHREVKTLFLRYNIGRWIICIFSLFLLISCGAEEKERVGQKVKQKRVVPKERIERVSKDYNFFLKSMTGRDVNIKTNSGYYSFSHIKKPIVLISFFSTWCPPCIGELPHLNRLQERYQDRLSILGILLYDDELTTKDLKSFVELHKIDFFLSNNIKNNVRFANFITPKLRLNREFSIPLMILFVKGRYYTHYEGAVPEEMIESDIKQAINQIERK